MTGTASAPADVVVCHSYTKARRHPKVIGKIMGWTLPAPVTPLQLGVTVGGFLLLMQTRGIWAHFPPIVNLALILGLPITLAVLLRHLRVEGRSPARFLLGYAAALSAPRHGRLHGTPVRPPQPQRSHGQVFTFPDPTVREEILLSEPVATTPVPVLASVLGPGNADHRLLPAAAERPVAPSVPAVTPYVAVSLAELVALAKAQTTGTPPARTPAHR